MSSPCWDFLMLLTLKSFSEMPVQVCHSCSLLSIFWKFEACFTVSAGGCKMKAEVDTWALSGINDWTPTSRGPSRWTKVKGWKLIISSVKSVWLPFSLRSVYAHMKVLSSRLHRPSTVVTLAFTSLAALASQVNRQGRWLFAGQRDSKQI